MSGRMWQLDLKMFMLKNNRNLNYVMKPDLATILLSSNEVFLTNNFNLGIWPCISTIFTKKLADYNNYLKIIPLEGSKALTKNWSKK